MTNNILVKSQYYLSLSHYLYKQLLVIVFQEAPQFTNGHLQLIHAR